VINEFRLESDKQRSNFIGGRIMGLKEDILRASNERDLDPYMQSFKPSELGLKSSDYGSFSDYCENTKSAKWNRSVILKPVKFNKAGRPWKYLLLK
jgi:hypothetical protein